ncbi:MAG: hypothetical protein A3H51_02020 [Candidatus Spechtbacteria bacterium RIFCSPLOWO2_02_FULL_38_8]|uniref:dolichyl-phosphate beta-glucosyltransferase n=1 Tax=Candidatus Spechtbacteria bacterium RIFCSPLOWO2_02_FULL_38_8 TaxID=1802164 RepID=A0A1G2HH64_9BACT|nr:MAG: hypothetical protein A3H51_02020 [Candidatus Spechtbacteria bacterium RIFCSPLOWO2_02_FULL_38_8]
MKLSVIIPAYNEATRIGNTLLDVDKYLSEQDYEYEILVSLDGPTDNTKEIVENYKKLVKNLRVIGYEKNQGKGVAVRSGMLEAKGEWRLFMDADGSTSIDHLNKMWPLTQNGYKVIISSREKKDVPGAKVAVPQSFVKEFLGKGSNLLIQIFGVWGIWDTQNGFKMFHQDAAKKIFSIMRIKRWGFDIEALVIAKKLKYKIGIVPAYWINDAKSLVTFLGPNGYVHTFLELLKIRWNLISNKYDIKSKNKEK